MTEQPVLVVPDARAIQDELQQLVPADLLGPLDGEHEDFQREDPLDRYLLGRLAPRGEVIEPDFRSLMRPEARCLTLVA